MHGLVMLRALWGCRGFVVNSVLREFNCKRRESLFGVFWSVPNPLIRSIIHTVIFSTLLKPSLAGHTDLQATRERQLGPLNQRLAVFAAKGDKQEAGR